MRERFEQQAARILEMNLSPFPAHTFYDGIEDEKLESSRFSKFSEIEQNCRCSTPNPGNDIPSEVQKISAAEAARDFTLQLIPGIVTGEEFHRSVVL